MPPTELLREELLRAFLSGAEARFPALGDSPKLQRQLSAILETVRVDLTRFGIEEAPFLRYAVKPGRMR